MIGTKAKAIVFSTAMAICPECRGHLSLTRKGDTYVFSHSDFEHCSNYGKTYKVPTIELEEIAQP